MITETELWIWFLFGGHLSPQRAKPLLERWTAEGRTLTEALATLPSHADALGITPEEEAVLSSPPAALEASPLALRWNEPLYPAGLRSLPLRQRPALLFYAGASNLLLRPLVYLAPGELPPAVHELLEATISQILGESLLVGAIEDSPQADLLLGELYDSEGEAWVLTRQGLSTSPTITAHGRLVDDSRLLVVTPLPPAASGSPAIDATLHQVALAMASHIIFTDPAAVPLAQAAGSRSGLLLTSQPVGPHPLPAAVRPCSDASEALQILVSPPLGTDGPAAARAAQELGPGDIAEPKSPAPSLTPLEILRKLEEAGTVPESLRRRLLGGQ